MSSSVQTLYQRYRLTVDDYRRMSEAGIFHENDRVELIDGEIIKMAPTGSLHAGTVDQLTRLFILTFGQNAIIRVQNPIVLDDYSEPEPDLALLTPREDFYKSSHPIVRDLLLVVEIADSSLAYDREVKLPLYARSHIPEVWIVDLENRCVRVFQDPAEEGFARTRTLAHPYLLTPLRLPACEIDLSALFRRA